MPRPTSFQKEIAKRLGITLRGTDSVVAAARIRDHVALALDPDDTPRAATEKQFRFATDLGVYTPGDSFRVCAAKIQSELTQRNAEALRKLRLAPGDVVQYTYCWEFDGEVHVDTSQHIVSSIGKDLRVYFKSPGRHSGAWPSQLTKLSSAQAQAILTRGRRRGRTAATQATKRGAAADERASVAAAAPPRSI